MRKSVLSAALLTAVIALSSFTFGDEPKNAITLTFVDHLKAGLIEQDVFVEKVPGSGEVYRVLPSERDQYLNSRVYTTATTHHHDPFDQSKTGPYKKGQDLGITLGQWLEGNGSATYSCEAGWGTLKANFKNLAPNATYTMWHFFMSAPPTVPFNGTLDVPLGDRNGEQSVFTTDANGNANLEITFEHCLQLSNTQLMSGLAIALHSDGKTYGANPGDFGSVTHVQLFAMLPNVKDVE